LEGKIAKKDSLPQETKLEESANCLAGHGRAGLKKNKCPRSMGVYGLDVAGFGRSGPEILILKWSQREVQFSEIE